MNYRDKLLLFDAQMLLNKREILDSFDDFVRHHQDRRNEEGYSEGRHKMLLSLCDAFRQALVSTDIPRIAKHWRYYHYEVTQDSIELTLWRCTEVTFDADGEVDTISSSEEYKLIEVKCDYLTVEQFASLHQVTDITVRQWIRRGKLRTAKKEGRDWLIPALTDKPTRGFMRVTYYWDSLPPEISEKFPWLRDSQSVYLHQGDDKKTFHCTTQRGQFVLDKVERERLELALIGAKGVTVDEAITAIQFVPGKRISSLPILSAKENQEVQLPFSDIIIGPHRNDYARFSTSAAIGAFHDDLYPAPYLIPLSYNLWGVLPEREDTVYDVIDTEDFSSCVHLGVVAGHLILCTQMIADGYDPWQVCDDESADLAHVMFYLRGDGGPLNDLTGEPLQNVFYVDELAITEEWRGKGVGTRVLQELPYLVRKLNHIGPDILTYYLPYPPLDNSEARLTGERIGRFYHRNGFLAFEDERVLYTFTGV